MYIAGCPDDTWTAVIAVFRGRDCPVEVRAGPPEYLSVTDFDQCLQSQKAPTGTHSTWCMPASKPASCSDDSWADLQDKFDGDACQASQILIGGDLGALPPAYLSLPDLQFCLGEYQASDTHTAWCMPAAKPSQCSQDSWNELRVSFDGVGCPARQSPPRQAAAAPSAYLSVPGYDKCLGEFQASSTHTELCLPRKRVPECLEPSWMSLLDVFEGVQCPPVKIVTGGVVQVQPPAWLSVPGHQFCLEVYQASATHSEYCLPAKKPDACHPQSWTSLQDVWDSILCAKQGTVVQAGPPAYLSVPGFRDCLGSYEPTSTHSEYCLPPEMPEGCIKTSYDALANGAFTGITCPKRPVIQTILGGPESVAPAYLSVPSYELCLDTFQAEGALHSEFCMPGTKPDNCPQTSWDELQIAFFGIGCLRLPTTPVAQVGPPAYLSVTGHADCLGSHTPPGSTSSQFCLPKQKPPLCLDASWEQLQDPAIFSGIVCALSKEEQQQVLALPPAYLSIEGHRACLREYQASDSHTGNCLPLGPPQGCSQEAFIALLQYTTSEAATGVKAQGKQNIHFRFMNKI